MKQRGIERNREEGVREREREETRQKREKSDK